MHRDIIVMGASAGGVEALSATVAGLPPDLDAAVFVVLHMPPSANSALPALLQRRTALPAAAAEDGEPIEHGRIYVAPPDHHVLLREGTIRVSRGPRENGHRPAIDPLFRSAARLYGPRVIGTILSGTLDDGARGLQMIAWRGGAAVVQRPDDAAFPGMPAAALEAVPDAIQAPIAEIGQVIAGLSRSEVSAGGNTSMPNETGVIRQDVEHEPWRSEYYGEPSAFTCPECHGTLFFDDSGKIDGFRCRVGHAFSTESLLSEQSEALEAALWIALRTLEERNDLTHRLAERARQ